MQQIKDLKKEAQKGKKDSSQKYIANIIANSRKIEDVSIVTEIIDGVDKEALRKIIDLLKKSLRSVAIILGSIDEDRVTFITAFSNDLVNRGLHAGDLAKDIAKIVDGGGGGRADMAQAGGRYPKKVNEAFDFAFQFLRERIK